MEYFLIILFIFVVNFPLLFLILVLKNQLLVYSSFSTFYGGRFGD